MGLQRRSRSSSQEDLGRLWEHLWGQEARPGLRGTTLSGREEGKVWGGRIQSILLSEASSQAFTPLLKEPGKGTHPGEKGACPPGTPSPSA